jgi:hypothetical protein
MAALLLICAVSVAIGLAFCCGGPPDRSADDEARPRRRLMDEE